MGCNGIIRSLQATLVLVILASFTVSVTSVYDGALDLEASMTLTGRRNLLQLKKSCSLDLEHMDYTNITTKCKEPYPADQCCPAFKELVCPIVSYLNNLTTDCANTLYSYLNTHCGYPPGLFISECLEGPEGMKCPHPRQVDVPAPDTNSSSSGVHAHHRLLNAYSPKLDLISLVAAATTTVLLFALL